MLPPWLMKETRNQLQFLSDSDPPGSTPSGERKCNYNHTGGSFQGKYLYAVYMHGSLSGGRGVYGELKKKKKKVDITIYEYLLDRLSRSDLRSLGITYTCIDSTLSAILEVETS